MENTDITVTILRYLENTDITVTILRNIQGITTATWRRDRAAIGKRKRLISIWWLYITKLLNFVKNITKLLNFMKYLLMKYFTKLLNLMKYFTKLLPQRRFVVICLLFSYTYFQVTPAVFGYLVLKDIYCRGHLKISMWKKRRQTNEKPTKSSLGLLKN